MWTSTFKFYLIMLSRCGPATHLVPFVCLWGISQTFIGIINPRGPTGTCSGTRPDRYLPPIKTEIFDNISVKQHNVVGMNIKLGGRAS